MSLPSNRMELCVLASGSSGNCAAVRTPAGVLLIDAGIGPRTAADRLKGTGVCVADVSAVCLTHLDRDHFTPNWVAAFARRGVRVFCHASRTGDLLCSAREACREGPGSGQAVSKFAELITPFEEAFEPLPGLSARAVPLSHDAEGSHGFVLQGHGSSIGYATDLGHVPPHLLTALESVDVLALESNYNAQMQRDSGRPWFLQRRITGGRGHLSNEQAFEAVRGLRPPPAPAAPRPRTSCCCTAAASATARCCSAACSAATPGSPPGSPWPRRSSASGWLAPEGRGALTGEQLFLAWG